MDAEKILARMQANRIEAEAYHHLPHLEYTPPSPEHYPHKYLWDLFFMAILAAKCGDWHRAASEMFCAVDGQHPNGFVANTRFAPNGRNHDFERSTYMEPKKESDYSQPPISALGALKTYESHLKAGADMEAEVFLEQMYPRLNKFYGYFADSRQNGSGDYLIGNIHPHETGRDSDPTFDFIKLRLPRKGANTNILVDKANIALDYLGVLALNSRARMKKWDVEEIKKMFWVNDVMFNCMYADNLALMSQLAEEHGSSEDAQRYEDLAGEVESQILSDMWFPNEKDGRGVFYALNKGEPIKEVSISNLFPLVLPRLTEKQLESQLELILTSFNTAYPLPSVATDSPNYDPKNQESERLWRGSTWINTNWYLVERGLRRQAERPDLAHRPELITLCSEIADRVVLASREMVNGSLAEHYNPDTGAGQRLHRSPNFAWSLLAHVMKTSAELEVEKLELVGVEWK